MDGEPEESRGKTDEDNPFSFKKFVERTSTDVGTKGGGGKDGGKKRSSQDAGSVPFPEEGGDNPFSFKQFVRKQTLADESSDEHSFSNSLDTIVPSTKDPPLVLPHSNTSFNITTMSTSKDKNTKKSTKTSSQRTSQPISTTARRKSSTKKQKDRLFTDTDSDSDSFTTSSKDISLPFPTSTDTQVVTSDPLHVLDDQREKTASVLRLSDSSDDDNDVVTHGQGSSLQSIESSKQAEKLKQQCSQLSTENTQLKMELENFKEKYQKEKQKNSKLREQLQSLKKKETEETKALEDMVAKVEKNLVTSTNKAITAEATISKLKQEIQSLQVQLSQADAQSVHRHYEEVLSGVRDKATFASRQLSMASMAADQSIRELLSGVDTLKNIAEVLRFIDRISEVKQR